MKGKNFLKILIFILVICFVVILVILFEMTIANKNTSNPNDMSTNNSVINEIQTNEITNNTQPNNETGNSNQIDYTNSDYIFYHEAETGNVQYNREQLNNFEFTITGIPEKVESYIQDMDEFQVEIKEYIYKNGLVDANMAEFKLYELNEKNKQIGMVFELNNEDQDKILVRIDLNNQHIQISNYMN